MAAIRTHVASTRIETGVTRIVTVVIPVYRMDQNSVIASTHIHFVGENGTRLHIRDCGHVRDSFGENCVYSLPRQMS